MPTPLRLVRVEIACSTLGNLRKALRVSVCTAFGVLMRTRLVNCGKNFPRCKNRHSFFITAGIITDFYTKMFSIEQYTEVSSSCLCSYTQILQCIGSLLCFVHENFKKVPSEVGYFSKIEENFPYCPQIEIHFGNVAQEVSVSCSLVLSELFFVKYFSHCPS